MVGIEVVTNFALAGGSSTLGGGAVLLVSIRERHFNERARLPAEEVREGEICLNGRVCLCLLYRKRDAGQIY